MTGKLLVAGGVILLLVLLVLWACNRGQRIKRDLATAYPPPGEMIDLGGYRLHIHCQGGEQGGDKPAVVFEAAEFSTSWASVQPEVAQFARACTYDRAGLGWSERGSQPRTVENIVDELHALLERAGVRPPYVMVGHSKGGMYVRYFAHEYPDEVAGIILVDSAHEAQELRFPETITGLNQRSRAQASRLLSLVAQLNSIGLITPLLVRYSDTLMGTIPSSARAMSLSVVLSDQFLETVVIETGMLEAQFAEVREAQISSLGEIPLRVLTAPDQFAALEGRVPPEDLVQLTQVVGELQGELAALSPNGELVWVPGSGHHIQVDQPQAVIDAIRDVVEAARR